jgi:hypothetical protein
MRISRLCALLWVGLGACGGDGAPAAIDGGSRPGCCRCGRCHADRRCADRRVWHYAGHRGPERHDHRRRRPAHLRPVGADRVRPGAPDAAHLRLARSHRQRRRRALVLRHRGGQRRRGDRGLSPGPAGVGRSQRHRLGADRQRPRPRPLRCAVGAAPRDLLRRLDPQHGPQLRRLHDQRAGVLPRWHRPGRGPRDRPGRRRRPLRCLSRSAGVGDGHARDQRRRRADRPSQPIAPAPCVAYDGCAGGRTVRWCQHADTQASGHGWPRFAAAAAWAVFQATP